MNDKRKSRFHDFLRLSDGEVLLCFIDFMCRPPGAGSGSPNSFGPRATAAARPRGWSSGISKNMTRKSHDVTRRFELGDSLHLFLHMSIHGVKFKVKMYHLFCSTG